jgi:hypothetical protein
MLQSSASNVIIPHQGTHQICDICSGLPSGVGCDDFELIVLRYGSPETGRG